MSAGTCRICGCTDVDCRACVERTGEACSWAEDDLCSACTGWTLINLERVRQREDEGYDAAHDDAHKSGELADAAFCYARPPANRTWRTDVLKGKRVHVPKSWPWEASWWRPSTNRISELIKAGALFLAERDRQLRAGDKAAAAKAESKGRSIGVSIDLYASSTARGKRWLRAVVRYAAKQGGAK